MASSQNGNLGMWSGYTPGDNGWTSQHNFNWDALDALVQPVVINTALTTPPGSPANGDAYIVPSGATGAWSGQTNKIAAYQRGAWAFYTPKAGFEVRSLANASRYYYNGSAWVIMYLVPPDYISGLEPIYNSTNSISVGTGQAYIQSLGRVSVVSSTLTLSSLSLSASTWYHVYLFESSGTPTIECVTTAPSAPYLGYACTKTGDNTRRYLYSIKTDASGNVLNWLLDNGNMLYRNTQDGAPFRVLTNGTATTETTVALAGCVPVTARSAMIRIVNTNTNASASLYTGTSDDSAAGPPTSGIVGLSANGAQAFLPHPLNPSQQMSYWFSAAPTGSGAFIDVYGYALRR